MLLMALYCNACSRITWHVMRYDGAAYAETGFASSQDSLNFSYTFKPDDLTIGIQVKNNGAGMMHLYPDKSLVVCNGMVQPWTPAAIQLQASMVTQSNPDPSLINTRSEITGSLAAGPRPLILPPGSYTTVTAPAAGIFTPADSAYLNSPPASFNDNGFRYSLTTIRYAETQSPHKMLVYTAYGIDGGPVRYKKDSFYLAELNKCGKKADAWMQRQLASGRVFRAATSKTTLVGAAVGTVFLAGVIIGALAAADGGAPQ